MATYYPRLPRLNKITRNYLPVLHVSQRLKEAIPDAPIIAFRRPRNLRDLLVRAELKSTSEDTGHNGNSPCNSRWCKTCQHIKAEDTFRSTITGQTYAVYVHLPPARQKTWSTSSSAENSISVRLRMPYTSTSTASDWTLERRRPKNR